MAGLAPTGASRLVAVCAGAALGVGAIAMDGAAQARADAQSANLTSSVDLWGSSAEGAGQTGCRIVSGGASRISVSTQWVRGQKAVLSGSGWTVAGSARAFVSVALDEGRQLRPSDKQLPTWAQRALADDRQVWDVVELDAQGSFTAEIAVPDEWEAGSRHTVVISNGESGAPVTFSVFVVGALTPLRPENCANGPEKPVPAEPSSSPSPSPSAPSPSVSPSAPSPSPSSSAPSASVSPSPSPSAPSPSVSPSAPSPSPSPSAPSPSVSPSPAPSHAPTGAAPTISREPELEWRGGGARAVEDGAAPDPEPVPTTAAPRVAGPSAAPSASDGAASTQVPAVPAAPARTQESLPAAPGAPGRAAPQDGSAGEGAAEGPLGSGPVADPSPVTAPAARPTAAQPSASPSTEPTRVSADAAVPPNAGGGSSEESASGLNSWVMVGGAGLLLLGVTVAFTFIRRMAHPH